MTIFQDVFGGANIYPSDVSYSAAALTADVTLAWPEETSAIGNYVTRIMDVSAAVANWSLIMPDARGAGTGETVLINNTGGTVVLVKNSAGTQLVSVEPGDAWQVYLTDNSTAAGAWRVFQYGVGTSVIDASTLAGTGVVAIGTTLSQSVPVYPFSADYALLDGDRAKMFVWNGGAGTLTLPNPVTVGNNWFIYVRNAGTGSLTVDTDGVALVDGLSAKIFAPSNSAILASDGTNFYSLGFGQAIDFAFDYTSINVAGIGDYTLTGSELNRIAYKFVGALTGDRTIVVPPTVQQYWINNQTSGGYLFRVKVNGGGGIYLNANSTTIVYSDGATVVSANNSSSVLSTVSGGVF